MLPTNSWNWHLLKSYASMINTHGHRLSKRQRKERHHFSITDSILPTTQEDSEAETSNTEEVTGREDALPQDFLTRDSKTARGSKSRHKKR